MFLVFLTNFLFFFHLFRRTRKSNVYILQFFFIFISPKTTKVSLISVIFGCNILARIHRPINKDSAFALEYLASFFIYSSLLWWRRPPNLNIARKGRQIKYR